MILKAKLIQIGNSLWIIIPREDLDHIEIKHQVNVITKGDDIYLEVITDDMEYWDEPMGVITKEAIKPENVITKPPRKQEVITPITKEETNPFLKKPFNTQWCSKHSAMKGSCGCK